MENRDIQYFVEGYLDKLLLSLLEIPEKHIYIRGGNSGIARGMKNQKKNFIKQ